MTAAIPLQIKEAEGAVIKTSEGEEIIDAISSWWVTLHGHCHPHIAAAIKKQLERLEHVMFADFTHAPAVALAESLLEILPQGFSRVFYSDNGSTAVETALKASFQYWHNGDPETERKKAVAFRGGYHGDTFGAMSVSDRGLFTLPFQHALFETVYVDPPFPGKEEESLEQMRQALSGNQVACFIFEPIIQGVGGMRSHAAAGLDALLALCQKQGVLTIADEVMTGFGRTGPHFAIERLKHRPDMLCLSKGITGGFLPLGVTVFSEAIYERFLSRERAKAFLHGHSYCGNPLACAAGIASLELLCTEHCGKQRKHIEKAHLQFMDKWKGHPKIARIEVTGTILALEYVSMQKSSYYNTLRDRLFAHFRSRHVLIRPFGNTIHVLPPYCIEEQQLLKVYAAIEETLENDTW